MALLNTWASQQDQATLSPLDRLLNNYIQKGDAPLSYLMRGDAQGLLKDLNTPKPVNTTRDMTDLALNLNPVMGLIGATAFHGSPYLFNKFDINKVGSGEGAQAFGHGIYFAENPEIAKEYAKSNIGRAVVNEGGIDNLPPAAQVEAYKLLQSKLPDDMKQIKLNELSKKLTPEQSSFIQSQMNRGNFYKVDIPDTSIPKMLEWDKSLSAQNKEIQPAINQALDKIKKLGGEVDKTKMTGKDLYFRYQQYRGNNPDFASEGLNDMGIYGIKYLDATSRGAGKGTNNYVVFDPSEVKILEKGLLK